jgi:hypothetical protein
MNAHRAQLDIATLPRGGHRRYRQRAAAGIAAVTLSAIGVTGALAATNSQAAPSHAAAAMTVYAFSINGSDGGFVAAPGTNPQQLSQGDEYIINDQLTVNRKVKGGYPIIGHDSGTCTFTRIVNPHDGLASCSATAVLKRGSLTVQGVVEIDSSGGPRASDLAITGGTGEYAGARGTLRLRVAGQHEIFTITLR